MVFGKTELLGDIVDNFKRLCDGGFYTQRFFKTAIAKPVLAVCACK